MANIETHIINSDSINSAVSKIFANLKDANLGIILIGIYFIFNFGSIQGLYSYITMLRLPFALALITVLYALYLIISQKVTLEGLTTKIFIVFCLFMIAYTLISTISPIDLEYTYKYFLVYLSNYLIIIFSIKKRSQFILLVDIWLFAIFFSSYHGFFQGGLVWDNYWLSDQNQYAVLLVTAFPFLFFFWLHCTSKLKKIVYTVFIIFNLSGIVLAGSRGGILSFSVVGLICLIISKSRKKLFAIFTLIFLVSLFFIPSKFIEEVKKINPEVRDSSVTSREDLWGFAWKMFKDNPVIGVGPLNFTEYLYLYDTEEKYGKRNWKGTANVAHSTPLSFLSEIGIIGCSILVVLQYALFQNWKTIYKYKNNIGSIKMPKDEFDIYYSINNACLISQIGFWTASLFITLTTFPFYYILIPFSEALKNIFLNRINQARGSISR